MGLGRKLQIAMFMIRLLHNMVAAVLVLQMGTAPALPPAPLRHLHHFPVIKMVQLLCAHSTVLRIIACQERQPHPCSIARAL